MNQLALEGLFGKVSKLVTTKKLMDDGIIAKLKIKALVLKYRDDERKLLSGNKYHDEIDFIVKHERRQNFIGNLVKSLKGNTLILFRLVEKQGKPLFAHINNIIEHDNIHFISGEIDVEVREEVSDIVGKSTNAIICASLGCYSEGVDVPAIDNVIFVSPNKSKIAVIQSIGRGLRKTEDMSHCNLYDIADDLTHNKKQNYSLKHFFERMDIYNKEKFDYRIYNVDL